KHGVSSDRLVYLPHVIDNGRFEASAAEQERKAKEWRRELGIGEQDLVVLFAGKLEPKKNPLFLPRLATAVTSPEVKFLVVGNGVMEQELKELAREDKRFFFADFQNQSTMPVVYRAGDVFILPSQGPDETWGLAINEAMACSRPVLVSTRCGCAPDLVREEQNGIIFESHDITRCAKFLNSMVKDRASLKNMGNRSLQLIQEFTFHRITTTLLEFIGARLTLTPAKQK
ncbi:MAG TPA: glycosyltransferase family 4 protein, partial [Puia sp.]|nr:glycosyltransferase family 4 protein [Puia sp.]